MASASGKPSDGTPTFGNLHSFMEHLQRHRLYEWWPNVVMCERFKVIVGRVAGSGEEWDLNLLPVGVGGAAAVGVESGSGIDRGGLGFNEAIFGGGAGGLGVVQE